jgi:hypothetical protein
LGFSFEQVKIKTKPKALASCADGNKKFPYYRTTLSQTVVLHYDKPLTNDKIL